MANIQKGLESIMRKITQNPNTYIIFYRPTCPHCQKALATLREKNLQYKGYDLNKIQEKTQIDLLKILDFFTQNKEKIEFDPNHHTIPLIFFNAKFIGGNDKLQEILSK